MIGRQEETTRQKSILRIGLCSQGLHIMLSSIFMDTKQFTVDLQISPYTFGKTLHKNYFHIF